jgi:hypothetical protein
MEPDGVPGAAPPEARIQNGGEVMRAQTRRGFIKIAGLALLFLGILAAIGRAAVWPRRGTIFQALFRPPLEGQYGALTEEEFRQLEAFAEIIFPATGDPEPRELHAVVRRWVDDGARQYGLLALYRHGVRALASATHERGFDGPFHALPVGDRRAAAAALMDEEPDLPPAAEPLSQLLHFLDRVLNAPEERRRHYARSLRADLTRGIFSSHLGWTLVGYDSWPGVPSAHLWYTLPPPPAGGARPGSRDTPAVAGVGS